jgi:uncharacterized protein
MTNPRQHSRNSIDSIDQSNPTFEQVLHQRLSRRDVFRVGLVLGGTAAMPVLLRTSAEAATATPAMAPGKPFQLSSSAVSAIGSPTFLPITAQAVTDDAVRVPADYLVDVLIRWGDPLFADAPAFDLLAQTPESQAKQCGFNHDFQAFFPIGTSGNEGVLWINHEYTTGNTMFPGYDAKTTDKDLLKKWVDIELAAHGGTIVELTRSGATEAWKTRFGTRNRRITATTPMVMSGPARNDERLSGEVLGMLNNCSGGTTPWGTVLSAEENFNQYFANTAKVTNAATRAAHTRYGTVTGATDRGWEKYYDRFDLEKKPNEAFKYGWVVEIDPDDPQSKPIKRTALGRFKHEAAAGVVANSGQYVVYSGDDERFDYFYKYVSYGKYDPAKGKANGDLLDLGTLFVARLWPDGTGEWIPLDYNRRPELRASTGFADQADVLIRTRLAGDAVKATKMDRPEDVEVHPITGKIYVVMTNNARRIAAVTDEGETAANPRFDPRVGNRTGHIIEITEANDQHTSMNFRWEIFILAGDPAVQKPVKSIKDATAANTYFAGYTGTVSPIGSPDQLAFSPDGLMWIGSDGAPASIGFNDSLLCVPTTGPDRGKVMQFLSVPAGAETCGPVFTPDQSTVFVAVQHPGEDGPLTRAGDPTSNSQSSWPDGAGKAPRPATIAVRHKAGKKIGS